MTDDDLIMLWSLGGMELWAEFRNGMDNPSTIIHDIHTRVTHPYWNLPCPIYIILFKNEYVSISNYQSDFVLETLYVIDDIISFNPDERWWKLLFAKHWYEKNKEQFYD